MLLLLLLLLLFWGENLPLDDPQKKTLNPIMYIKILNTKFKPKFLSQITKPFHDMILNYS